MYFFLKLERDINIELEKFYFILGRLNEKEVIVKFIEVKILERLMEEIWGRNGIRLFLLVKLDLVTKDIGRII